MPARDPAIRVWSPPAVALGAVVVTAKCAAAGETIILTGIFTIMSLIIAYGPRYIRAYADLIRARKDERRPSDDD
jgi:hypothetical protein